VKKNYSIMQNGRWEKTFSEKDKALEERDEETESV
jgi:hypothetical protein